MDTFEFDLIISCYKSKRLLEYTNLFSPSGHNQNDNVILKFV